MVACYIRGGLPVNKFSVNMALESQLVKFAQADPIIFNRAIGTMGGAPGGEAGSGEKVGL